MHCAGVKGPQLLLFCCAALQEKLSRQEEEKAALQDQVRHAVIHALVRCLFVQVLHKSAFEESSSMQLSMQLPGASID